MHAWRTAEQAVLQLRLQLLPNVSVVWAAFYWKLLANSALISSACIARSFPLSMIASTFSQLVKCFLSCSGNRIEQLGTPYKKGKPCSSCQHSCHSKKVRCVDLLTNVSPFWLISNRFRLCMNTCNAADLWANCMDLYKTWPNWLCRTNTTEGTQRQHNCLATCNCKGKIHDWVASIKSRLILVILKSLPLDQIKLFKWWMNWKISLSLSGKRQSQGLWN